MNKLKGLLFLCTVLLFVAAVIGMIFTDSPNDWVEIVEEAGWISFVLLIVVTYLLDREPSLKGTALTVPEKIGWVLAALAVACQVVAIGAALVGDFRESWVEGIEVAGTFFTLILILVTVTLHIPHHRRESKREAGQEAGPA